VGARRPREGRPAARPLTAPRPQDVRPESVDRNVPVRMWSPGSADGSPAKQTGALPAGSRCLAAGCCDMGLSLGARGWKGSTVLCKGLPCCVAGLTAEDLAMTHSGPIPPPVLTQGLLPQVVPGSHRTPWHPVEDPLLGPSPDRECAMENASALVPGPLALLQDLQLLTQLSPQAKIDDDIFSTVIAPPYNLLKISGPP
jgi:hypothetical protein